MQTSYVLYRDSDGFIVAGFAEYSEARIAGDFLERRSPNHTYLVRTITTYYTAKEFTDTLADWEVPPEFRQRL